MYQKSNTQYPSTRSGGRQWRSLVVYQRCGTLSARESPPSRHAGIHVERTKARSGNEPNLSQSMATETHTPPRRARGVRSRTCFGLIPRQSRIPKSTPSLSKKTQVPKASSSFYRVNGGCQTASRCGSLFLKRATSEDTRQNLISNPFGFCSPSQLYSAGSD